MLVKFLCHESLLLEYPIYLLLNVQYILKENSITVEKKLKTFHFNEKGGES